MPDVLINRELLELSLNGDRGQYSDTLVDALGIYTDDWPEQHLPLLEGIYRNWAKRPRRPLGVKMRQSIRENCIVDLRA